MYMYTFFLAAEKEPRQAWSKVAHRAVGRESTGNHGTTRRNGPTTRKRRHQPTKRENDENTQSQACAHVVWCRLDS